MHEFSFSFRVSDTVASFSYCYFLLIDVDARSFCLHPRKDSAKINTKTWSLRSALVRPRLVLEEAILYSETCIMVLGQSRRALLCQPLFALCRNEPTTTSGGQDAEPSQFSTQLYRMQPALEECCMHRFTIDHTTAETVDNQRVRCRARVGSSSSASCWPSNPPKS